MQSVRSTSFTKLDAMLLSTQTASWVHKCMTQQGNPLAWSGSLIATCKTESSAEVMPKIHPPAALERSPEGDALRLEGLLGHYRYRSKLPGQVFKLRVIHLGHDGCIRKSVATTVIPHPNKSQRQDDQCTRWHVKISIVDEQRFERRQ